MKKTILMIILFGILIYLIFNLLNKQVERSTLKNFFDSWQVSLEGSENFLIKSYQERSFDGIKISELNAENQNQTIFVKRFSNVDADFQKKYFLDKMAELNSLFETTQAPYPGVVTRTIVCPDEFKPTVTEEENKTIESVVYVMYSNERFTYGVCSKDLIKYRAIFSLVYCKAKKEIYQIEYFKLAEEFSQNDVEKIKNFKCN